MTYSLSKLSRSRLVGVHPDLVKVVELAITLTKVDFRVQQGVRSLAEQKKNVARGASQTLNSRHLRQGKDNLAKAVDLVALKGRSVSYDWPLYYQIADAMKKAAKQLGIPIIWGGDWKRFKDGPHFELPRKLYP